MSFALQNGITSNWEFEQIAKVGSAASGQGTTATLMNRWTQVCRAAPGDFLKIAPARPQSARCRKERLTAGFETVNDP